VHSSLNTPDEDAFAGKMTPGTNCADAPIEKDGKQGWFLNTIGDGFVVLAFGEASGAAEVSFGKIKARVMTVGKDVHDREGHLTQRYDAKPGTIYLIRPDQHVAARWRAFDAAKIQKALARAVAAA
jgi:3-(3-hydroxy-phenyl)propionate hydroxylase